LTLDVFPAFAAADNGGARILALSLLVSDRTSSCDSAFPAVDVYMERIRARSSVIVAAHFCIDGRGAANAASAAEAVEHPRLAVTALLISAGILCRRTKFSRSQSLGDGTIFLLDQPLSA
jgi:hypothetical protein